MSTPMPLRAQRSASLRSDAFIVLFTCVAAVGVAALGLWGSDYPAQLYRAGLYREAGLTIWNSGWYSGHYTLGYSVLFPALGARFGVAVVGVASTVAAVILFAAIGKSQLGRGSIAASSWFAVAMVVNLTIGRITFGLGVTAGLAALLCLQRNLAPLAILLGAVTTLASPIAGVFLGLTTAAVGTDRALGRRRPWSLQEVRIPAGVTMAAFAPIAVSAVLFPSPGIFPFRAGHFFGVVGAGVGLIFMTSRHLRSVRIGAGFMLAMAVGLYLVPNPIGGNVVRLPTMFGWPLLTAVMLPGRPRLAALAAVPMAVWLLFPAVSVAGNLGSDAARDSYYRPVVDFIEAADGPAGRVEIPFTADHWEAAYVALDVPIARGWERQTDMARNPLFYDGTLDEPSYRRWLDANAVRWIAVPDVTIDHSGLAEVALIDDGNPAWLEAVWTNPNWVIYEVADAAPLVASPGAFVSRDANAIVVEVEHAGDVLIREAYTPYWELTGIDGCLRASAAGLTILEASEPGLATIGPGFSFDAALGTSADAC